MPDLKVVLDTSEYFSCSQTDGNHAPKTTAVIHPQEQRFGQQVLNLAPGINARHRGRGEGRKTEGDSASQ